MNYEEFLEKTINSGKAAAEKTYENDALCREGAVKGFESCRGKQPHELFELLTAAREEVRRAYLVENPGYWNFRCCEAEIEWVCNVVSAMLVNQGLTPIVAPTYHGVMKADEILSL